ncbi:hypothetical protein JYT99_02930 [bacterium AH-315-E09]|nr:hypothetical protein [bacterium AH-315-L21]MBN4074865.1 hypothetical protein [bacterium AH-315-E09]
MNKKTTVSSIAVLMLILVIVTLQITNAHDKVEGFDLAIELASVIRESKELTRDRTEIAIVDGLPIYNDELELRKRIFDVIERNENDSNYNLAFNWILLRKHEAKVARKLGLSVTDEEISREIEAEKEAVYSPSNNYMSKFRQYVSELGLTEDEYWSDYRRKELRRYLTYLKVKNIASVVQKDVSSIKFDITDLYYRSRILQED